MVSKGEDSLGTIIHHHRVNGSIFESRQEELNAVVRHGGRERERYTMDRRKTFSNGSKKNMAVSYSCTRMNRQKQELHALQSQILLFVLLVNITKFAVAKSTHSSHIFCITTHN
ncbi:hypothetical protein ACP275_10G172800 [Erythranthe tilingii]